MEVTKQTNPNECGVCVISSLVKHFYHQDNKQVILNDANISGDGLSIFNFEHLAQQYGIFVETFQLDWQEFISLKNNDYMVCPIKKNGGLHYVIVKKHKYELDIYDSTDGKYRVNIREFAKSFCGIIMMIGKMSRRINISSLPKLDLWRNLDWKYLIVSLLMEVVIIGLGAISADYFNIMINHAIATKSLSDGLTFTFIFLIFYLLEELGHYILSLYTSKYFKINFHYLSRELIYALKQKRKSFLNKVDSNYFYLIDTSMQSITVFLVSEISGLCSNILLLFVTTTIISIINPWFLIIVIISGILAIGFNFIQYHYRKHLMKIGIENQRVNNSINHNYIDYLRDQCNSIVASELTSQLEQNYSNYQCIYLSQSKFNGAFNFAEGMAQKLIYLVLVMFGSYLIIEQKNLDLGQLIFLINLMVMMSGALNGICGFVVKKIEYVQMSEIYKNFISLENHENKCTTTISSVRTIKIDGKKIKSGQILERTNELVDALLLGQSDIKLQINDVNIDMLSKQNYFSKLFIINYNTKLSKDWLRKNFDQTNNIFLDALTKFDINISTMSPPNIYEQTLINILCSLLLHEQIVVFDDNLRYVTENNKKWIENVIFPYIKKHNYLLILKKDANS